MSAALQSSDLFPKVPRVSLSEVSEVSAYFKNTLRAMFGEDEDTQVDKLKRQVKEQGGKIELLQREISVLQNEKKSFFGFKRR